MKTILAWILTIVSFISPVIPNITFCHRKTQTMEFAETLGNGWNLGNSFDAYGPGFEGLDTQLAWHNPLTTKEIIDKVAASGFKTVRIPVTWFMHYSGTDTDFTIDKAWLDRIREVVGWVIADGMKAIIDVHHDDKAWLSPDNAHIDYTERILTELWRQVSTYFKDIGTDLVFETMNEPRVVADTEREWSGCKEYYECVNRLNQSAVNAIRSIDKERYILCPTYAAGVSEEILDAYKMPDDGRVIAVVHYYCKTLHDPAYGNDCEKGAYKTFRKKVNEVFADLYFRFILKGKAVIMDEFGWTDQINLDNKAERTAYYAKISRITGIPVCIWDDGKWFEILDRNACEWLAPQVITVLTGENVL